MSSLERTRAFMPPTEVETVNDTTYNIVWSLGTEDHPWKNLYIMEQDTEETSHVIDVYTALKYIAYMPTTERHAGEILSVDLDNSSLKWATINDELRTYASGSVLADVLASNPVQRSVADEEGVSLKDYYAKKSYLTSSKLVEIIAANPVARALADSDGNTFSDKYASKTYIADNYIKKGGLRDENVLAEVAFSGAWGDIQGKPSIPDYSTVQQMINNTVDPLKIRVSANEVNITQLQSNVDTLEANVVYKTTLATNSTKGILSVNESNGLTISSGVLSINTANSNSKPGVVKVSSGNGLNYSDGTISLATATASSAGAVKVSSGNGLTYTNGLISSSLATASSAGSVKVSSGNGLNYTNGLLSLSAASSSSYGTIKVNATNGLTYSSGVLGVSIASDSSYGTIKITPGNGLNYTNGILSTNVATASAYGTVKVSPGNGLSYNSGLISIGAASASTYGTIKISAGNGLNYISGVVSESIATTSTLGTVKIGSNITVNSGTISVSKTNVVNALGYTPLKINDNIGSATATTQTYTSNSTNVATTAFVQSVAKQLRGNTTPATVESILDKTTMASVSSDEIYSRGTNNDWKYGYGKGDVYLTKSYENYDKLLIITGNDGNLTFYTLIDVWALKLLFQKGTTIPLIKVSAWYWEVYSYIYGTTKSTSTLWRTYNQNSSIVDIIGIKY